MRGRRRAPPCDRRLPQLDAQGDDRVFESVRRGAAPVHVGQRLHGEGAWSVRERAEPAGAMRLRLRLRPRFRVRSPGDLPLRRSGGAVLHRFLQPGHVRAWIRLCARSRPRRVRVSVRVSAERRRVLHRLGLRRRRGVLDRSAASSRLVRSLKLTVRTARLLELHHHLRPLKPRAPRASSVCESPDQRKLRGSKPSRFIQR